MNNSSNITVYHASLFCIWAALWAACTPQEQSLPKHDYNYHDVGDIIYDSAVDSEDFSLCDSTRIIHSRSGTTYRGGAQQLSQDCKSAYQHQEHYQSYTGYVMVRFILNCQGQSGRFRAEALNPDFSIAACPTGLMDHIVDIVKSLEGISTRRSSETDRDHSKFINFKIVKGELQSIIL